MKHCLVFASLISPSKMILFEKFVKNTPLHVVFSTLFSVFHLVMKHCISCLIYYIKGLAKYSKSTESGMLTVADF